MESNEEYSGVSGSISVRLSRCSSRLVVENELRVSVETICGSTYKVNGMINERLEKCLSENWIEIERVYNVETKLMDIYYLKRSRK